jgi:hypothetical protein
MLAGGGVRGDRPSRIPDQGSAPRARRMTNGSRVAARRRERIELDVERLQRCRRVWPRDAPNPSRFGGALLAPAVALGCSVRARRVAPVPGAAPLGRSRLRLSCRQAMVTTASAPERSTTTTASFAVQVPSARSTPASSRSASSREARTRRPPGSRGRADRRSASLSEAGAGAAAGLDS